MTAFEHIRGGVIGLFVGALVIPIISFVATLLFRKGGGFIIDFAPLAILFLGFIWGAISGTIVGSLMLRPKPALIAGLCLPLSLILLSIISGTIEKGFSKTLKLLFKDGALFNLETFFFFAITILSSYLIAVVNWSIKK